MTVFQKLWNMLSVDQRHAAVILLGLMFVGMLLETLGIGLVIPVLALLTQGDFANSYPVFKTVIQMLGNPGKQVLVVGGMLVLVSAYLIKTLFLAMLAWRQAKFAFGVQASLSQRLFTVYLRQPYTFHLQHNSAHLIRNVTRDVNLLTFNAYLPGMLLFSEALVVLGLCGLLVIIEPLGTLIVVSVLGAVTWALHRFTRGRITSWGGAHQHHEGLRLQHLQEGLGGVKDVKLMGRETEFLDQYHVHNVRSAQIGQLQQTLQQLPRLGLELLAVIGIAMLVFSMVMQGRAVDTVLPTLGLFAAAAFRLMPSVNRIVCSMQSLRYGLPVVDAVQEDLELVVPEIPVNQRPAEPFCKTLELDRVTYVYPGTSEAVLKDISLAIQCGESVGLIGTSGAGKSTLVDILLGLLTPSAGEVRVDGCDIHENLRGWQDQIGYVPQSIYLTDDTLRRNVAFGVPVEQINDEAVSRAIQVAQLEEFVNNQPDGMNTLVGERGVRLSGGQRQRIGIARALYHDPAVIVLDEATSSLDTATEREVMQFVKALQGNKTVIIVAHRLSTIEHCNRVYRIHDGKVMEGRGDVTVSSDLVSSAIPSHKNISIR